MSNSRRDVRDLLERVAQGPVGPAPIADLVRRGARRRRTWQATGIGMTAAATAAVVVVVIGIAGQTKAPHAEPPPAKNPITQTVGGATAEQIAHGTWQNVPAPPIRSCGSRSVTSTGNRVLLVVSQGSTRCPNAAAAYNARTDNWTRFLPPPASLRGQLTSAQNLYVSQTTGAAAILNPRTGTWRLLAAAPASGSLAVLVAGTAQPFLIGAGPGHDQVFSFDGTRWISRPTLPHPGTDIVGLAAYSNGETQWAFASEEQATHDGFKGGLTLLRLGPHGWVKQPNLPNRPLVVRDVESLGDRQLVIGDNCLPGASCPFAGPQLGIADLGRGELRDLPDSPLMMAQTDAVLAGNSVVGLDTDAEVGSGGPDQPAIHPLASAVYDIASGHWLPGPHQVVVNNIGGMAWTPRGLVVLGDPAEKCVCSLGGLILRPAK